jgi:SNF2 family DNA or RNA helicase
MQSQIVVLDALLKLRQICCDPRLLKLDAARKVHDSAKLDALLELLDELLQGGHRVLLFSQFTSMLELVEQALTKRAIRYVKLIGDTRDRAKPVKAFQSGEAPLFLISLKAGGTGLNLTAADTVIHYDPWWNPAVENQATDRAHRIGQDKPVFVYKLIVSGSVEEKIAQLQEKKAALVKGVLGEGAATGAALTADDIRVLFEPIS